jgi:hypothetical protein
MGPPRLLAPLLTLSLASAACGGPAPAPHRLWTMADLQFESRRADCDNPAGLPCNYFVRTASDHDYLVFKLAFAESQPMAYMTTDFWANYDRIWLQPMYFLVTKWDQEAPLTNRLKEADGVTPAGPIFSVGTGSAFYSPFWSVFYVEVPAGTSPGTYTSARQLFEGGLIMHRGANRFASIRPATVQLPSKDEIKAIYEQRSPDQSDDNLTVTVNDYLAPLAQLRMGETEPLDRVIKSATSGSGWLDGAPVGYVDFGPDNFVADAAQLVQDVPLFVFTHRVDSGAVELLGAPNVGGVGEPFTGSVGRVSPGGRPQFGGLWRLWLVNVPRTARMFDRLQATGAADGEVPVIFKDRLSRVALNGESCFAELKDTQGMTDSCVWLDSQDALERNLVPSAFTRTGLQPACPLVMWKRQAVPPQ